MVRAWFMDDDVESDQRLEHHRTPPDFVDLTQLFDLTGVEYFKVSGKNRSISDVECLCCFAFSHFANDILIRKESAL